ncbi:MAG TPA: TetR/AcrR family transcriptional regulator [Candidatus Bathyarchaeia archaeon]|jgi:AcrR family transcriptional regulator|nr:TetR/AcrR family transcriptional regulator [Candidatus Bathyarchaeia archaeon]
MPRVVPEYKEEARTRILRAANQVFRERGYRQATMDDVAKKLGVSKGALYLYFASKEELFEAICRAEPLAFKQILYSSFSENKQPLDSASEFFDQMLKRYGSDSGLSFEILSEASHNPGLRRVLRKTQDDYAATLLNYLEEGQTRGFIDKELDLKSLTYALIALWNGVETLVVSGLPVDDARRAWLEGMKAIFLRTPDHKRSYTGRN